VDRSILCKKNVFLGHDQLKVATGIAKFSEAVQIVAAWHGVRTALLQMFRRLVAILG
jgi:hypothetical protein